MKKIGLICLAVVLALGSLGVAYAAWTQTVTIEQTVTTGSLEIGVRAEAELIGDEKKVASITPTHGAHKFDKEYFGETIGFYDKVTVALDNWYPCVEAFETFEIGVGGSIPLYMDVTLDIVEDGLFDLMLVSWTMELFRDGRWDELGSGKGAANAELPKIRDLLGCRQYYPCDMVRIHLYKYLPQEDTQNRSGEFTLTVTGIQYNKYEKPPEDPEDPEDPPEVSCETAMSAGTPFPNHAWFMYTPYEDAPFAPFEVDLLATADHTEVGTVHFSAVEEGKVTITITLDPDFEFSSADPAISIKGYHDEDVAQAQSNWPFCKWKPKGYPDPDNPQVAVIVWDAYSFYAIHANVCGDFS